MAGTVCNFATQLKFLFNYDDTLDIFASHAIGGILGNILTGFFAQSSIAALDGTRIPGGFIDHHYVQLGHQTADSLSGLAYSFVVTFIILKVIDSIPGLQLRASARAERLGIDFAELGEFAYDYVSLDSGLEADGVQGAPIELRQTRTTERRGHAQPGDVGHLS